MKTGILTFTLLLSLTFPLSLHAEEKHPGPNTSIGFAGSYGINSAYTVRGDDDWSLDNGWHGGLVFEKMFSNRIGMHSGFWYSDARYSFGKDVTDTSGGYTHIKSLSLPLDLILAFNGSMVSFNILTGINLLHIIDAKMYFDDGSDSADVLGDLNYFNMAFELGFQLKFRAGRFSDIFIGVTGDINMLNTVRNSHDNDYFLLWNSRVTAGFLFRTDLFPFADMKG